MTDNTDNLVGSFSGYIPSEELPIDPEFMRDIEISLTTLFGYAANHKELSPAMQKIRIKDLEQAEDVLDRISAWFER